MQNDKEFTYKKVEISQNKIERIMSKNGGHWFRVDIEQGSFLISPRWVSLKLSLDGKVQGVLITICDGFEYSFSAWNENENKFIHSRPTGKELYPNLFA